VSHHHSEAERLLELVDVSNLAPGDLATVVLAHAVLAVADELSDMISAIGDSTASLVTVIDDNAER
jgi:hypothetical protein